MEKDLLKQFTPFDGLQDEYLVEALEHIKLEQLEKGQMIFKRGRAVAARYFLLDGHVDLIDSQYQATAIKSSTVQSRTMLNPENPTRCSCVVKGPTASIFSIDAEALDRITAWSESAESAFEAEMSARHQDFDPTQTGSFDVIEVEEVHEEEAGDWMSALLKSPLFSRVPLTHVQDLFAKFEDVEAEPAQVVVKEGEKGDYFYVIANGKARVSNHSDSVNVELGPGQHFGEEALLGSTLRNATVTMTEPGQLKRLNAEDFQALLSEPVLQYVSQEALEQLDRAYKLIDVKMPLEYRVAHHKESINLPLSRLRSSMMDLAKTKVYVVVGDAGSRSKIAAHLLCQAGFEAYILEESSEAAA
ncbi:cyclic nucleotide-binding domain-containing protein [Agaribacterium haliotis]|uniref:cyclic nucleotide-binding domain-containing protein n=1 Tax=Agaribacterium haliotis TaxID=2013869 RepID=UPI000BB57A20|nr:cyclic nucleotide-binding domain-containing protein [Agaribacterium haliotis]